MERLTNLDDLITPKSLSKKSGYSRNQIYKLIKDQEIKPTLIDGVIFLNINDIPEKYRKKQ